MPVNYTDDDFANVARVNDPFSVKSLLIIDGNNLLVGLWGTGSIWKSSDNGASISEIPGNPQAGEDSINCFVKALR